MATNKYYCGVALELGGKEISLNPSTAINDIKLKGLVCDLPSSIELGQVSDAFDGIVEALGGEYDYKTLYESVEDIPIIGDAAALLGSATMNIEELSLSIPPSYKQIFDENGNPVTSVGDGQLRYNGGVIEKINETPKKETGYTAGFSLTWGNPVAGDTVVDPKGVEKTIPPKPGHLFGSLYLKGIYFKISNQD